MRVLIAPDKFKGSLTAAQVADHLATGLTEAGAHSRTLPLADGGDGSVAAALAKPKSCWWCIGTTTRIESTRAFSFWSNADVV